MTRDRAVAEMLLRRKTRPKLKKGKRYAKRSKKSTTKEPLSKKHENALREAFVKVLLKSPLGKVRFSDDERHISVIFFDEKFSYRIVIKREVNVGSWSKSKDEIFIDKEILETENIKSFKALCVHEAVEKFLVETYGLDLDKEAHVVATKKEEEYLKRIGGSWRSHQLVVYHLWDKLDRH